MNKRSTINDVAEMAGVSITTVSRVINGNYPVSEKTKKKVNTAIEALGFRPNLLARSLIQDRTQTIGIISPSIENLFFSEVIKGINQFMDQKDYRTFLCSTDGDVEKEKAMVDSLINRSVDGIIVIDPRTANIKSGFYEGISMRLPLVLINGYHDNVACNFILNDDHVGMMKAIEHFVNQGRKRIGMMLGRKSYSYDLKEEIYLEYLSDIKAENRHLLRIQTGNSTETVMQAKEKMVTYWKETKESMDALICGNDLMAVGALHAAAELGIKVPEELSIIGFDNSLVSQISIPSISTVDHHMPKLGNRAAKRMEELINEGEERSTEIIIIGTNLVIRET